MRKVKGEDITINELKKCYFETYDGENYDTGNTILAIDVEGIFRYILDELEENIIATPISLDDYVAGFFPSVIKKHGCITGYDFIIDECNYGYDTKLEDFVFYFDE